MSPTWERYLGVPVVFRVQHIPRLDWADWWSYVVLPQ